MISLTLNVILAVALITGIWYFFDRKKFWIKHLNEMYRKHDTLAYQINTLDTLIMGTTFWNPNQTRYQMVSHVLRLAARVDPTPIEQLWQHTVDLATKEEPPMYMGGAWEWTIYVLSDSDGPPPSFTNAMRASLARHKEQQRGKENSITSR